MTIAILMGLGCFASMAALDYALVRHQQAVIASRAAAAGAWSVATYALGLFAMLAATQVSAWYAIPSAAGLYAGNVLALRGKVSR